MVLLSQVPEWIDTVERAIVWAATLLRASNLAQDANFPDKNAIRITTRLDKAQEDYQGLIGLEISLRYSSAIMLVNGGDFLPAITPFTNSPIPTTSYFCPPIGDQFETLAASNPTQVSTLEQYLYWVCSILYASLPLNNKIITFQFLEENSSGAIAQFKINLPFDYSQWIEDRNLVCSVLRTVETYVYPANSLQILGMGNNLAMNNLALMGN